jgi:hypothetical protein
MTKIVATHKVKDVKTWLSYNEARAEVLGAFGTDVKSYADPNGSNRIAVTMDLTDREGFEAFMLSEDGLARMKRHGILTPVKILPIGD